jgi:hypothetical protein
MAVDKINDYYSKKTMYICNLCGFTAPKEKQIQKHARLQHELETLNNGEQE